MELVMDNYNISSDLLKNEIYGLIGRMCHAVVSVPSNTTEDTVRNSWRSQENLAIRKIMPLSIQENITFSAHPKAF